MNITKKPHFVPATYLQFWSVDNIPNGRKSKIYVTDINGSRITSASKTGVARHFYSKTDPNKAEEYFQKFENAWTKLVKELLENKGPKPEILSCLFLLHSSQFLIRNRCFENLSEKERIEIYHNCIETYWTKTIMNNKIGKTHEESLKLIEKNWTCLLIRNKDERFITSDNPTLTLNAKGKNPAIIYIAINPKISLLALSNQVIKLKSNNVTEQDIDYLNNYTIGNCNREVYSNKPLEKESLSKIIEYMKIRPERNSTYNDKTLHLKSYDYPILGMEFSFIE
ncbi:DUF4238 domain-containing protein [Algibacter pectinivorans]|uniref:DUF4238 domain-containing protein n=1 Tax=Algibacter pectinivorans TaxID=870482 RepID=A0A1I1NKI6_9FLAO|nr:DUF4238 domain-containing protein [Algibacter pectinivorans]SFC98047.1 Protein of unknown function [Algibacter pectinivorans]